MSERGKSSPSSDAWIQQPPMNLSPARSPTARAPLHDRYSHDELAQRDEEEPARHPCLDTKRRRGPGTLATPETPPFSLLPQWWLGKSATGSDRLRGMGSRPRFQAVFGFIPWRRC